LLPGISAKANECAVNNGAEAMAQLRKLFTVFGDDWQTELTIRDAG
jgi:hypothetical protein